MGLDTTHNCWHGSYGTFNSWRRAIAGAAGLPPLDFMEGFYRADRFDDPTSTKGHHKEAGIAGKSLGLPIRWDALRPSVLHILLNHSDCEGNLHWDSCAAIADELEALLPKLNGWENETQQFIYGLRKASAAKEDVLFH